MLRELKRPSSGFLLAEKGEQNTMRNSLDIARPLEWSASNYEDGENQTDALTAHSPVGTYIAEHGGWFLVGRTGWMPTEDRKEALAEAQADFNERTLESINPEVLDQLPLLLARGSRQ